MTKKMQTKGKRGAAIKKETLLLILYAVIKLVKQIGKDLKREDFLRRKKQ